MTHHQKAKADLILKNANVLSLETNQLEADMVAIKGETILTVGSNCELEQVKDFKTRVIDCGGRTVIPGFNDAHCHLFSFIRKLFSIDLSPPAIQSIADIKAALHRQAQNTPQGKWLNGTGYNEFYLAEKRHPTRWDIDEVAPSHPVILAHRSLHACVLNSPALSLAGITAESEAPPGGLIERDIHTGEPTGLLYEMLGDIRKKVMPPTSDEELLRGIKMANRHYLSLGITSIQEATITNDLEQWHTFRRFKELGNLDSRVYMMLGSSAIKEFREIDMLTGSGDIQLRLGSVKIVLSETTGQLAPSQEELNKLVLESQRAGFQVAIHAIERSTVEAALQALEYAHQQLADNSDRRPRIEHCSQCSPDIIRRLRRLNAVVVTQPPFVYYSGERYLAKIPAQELVWLYPFNSLMSGGLMVAGSSDSPIVPVNPLMGIYAAITRKAETGDIVTSKESISAEQALAMYTCNAAFASFEENIKGSLSPGKLADIAVLSSDPITSPPEKLKEISVNMTIIGGHVVFES